MPSCEKMFFQLSKLKMKCFTVEEYGLPVEFQMSLTAECSFCFRGSDFLETNVEKGKLYCPHHNILFYLIIFFWTFHIGIYLIRTYIQHGHGYKMGPNSTLTHILIYIKVYISYKHDVWVSHRPFMHFINKSFPTIIKVIYVHDKHTFSVDIQSVYVYIL